MKIPFKAFGAMGAMATAAMLSACSEGPTQPQTGPGAPSFYISDNEIDDPEVEVMRICKVGPPGTYEFDATATLPVLLNTATGAFDQTTATFTATVTAGSTIDVEGSELQGACVEVASPVAHNVVALAGGTIQAEVTVVEDEAANPTGVEFVSVDTYQKTGGETTGTVAKTSSTTNSASVDLGGVGGVATTLMGGNVVFYNEPEEGEDEGCTPGFWKQSQHFQYWTAPYDPTDLISSVFNTGGLMTSKGVVLGNQTLLAGLSFSGGPTVGDAAAILLRAAIAGLLNAADDDVNYYLTEAQLIAAVDAALASGNRNTMLTLAATIDAENNSGCTAKD